MAAEYRFVLADNVGNDLAELTTAAGKVGRYKRNYYSEWAMTISHEDDAAYEFDNCLRFTGIPRLKVWRKAEGATTFVEVGPGRVLSGLLRRIVNGARGQSVEDPAGLEKVLTAVAGDSAESRR